MARALRRVRAEAAPRRSTPTRSTSTRGPAREDTFVTGSTAFMFDNSYRPPIFGHFFTLGARAFVTRHQASARTSCRSTRRSPGRMAATRAPTGRCSGHRAVGGLCGEAPGELPLQSGVGRPQADRHARATTTRRAATTSPAATSASSRSSSTATSRARSGASARTSTSPTSPGGGRYGNMDELPLFNVHILKAAVSVALSDKIEIGAGYLYGITADDEGYGRDVRTGDRRLRLVHLQGQRPVLGERVHVLPRARPRSVSRTCSSSIPPTRRWRTRATTWRSRFYLQALIQF